MLKHIQFYDNIYMYKAQIALAIHVSVKWLATSCSMTGPLYTSDFPCLTCNVREALGEWPCSSVLRHMLIKRQQHHSLLSERGWTHAQQSV